MIFTVQHNDTSPRLVVSNDSRSKEIVYALRSVRAAVSWPTRFSRIYFLVMAQLLAPNEEGKCPLVLIDEAIDESPARLFQRLIESSTTNRIEKVYADLNPKHEEMVTLFGEIRRYHGFRSMGFTDAITLGEFQTGLGLIDGWLSSMTIPEGSILRDELDSITEEDRESDTAEKRFPAIRALGYLVSSLETGPWGVPAFVLQKDAVMNRKDPRGWT